MRRKRKVKEDFAFTEFKKFTLKKLVNYYKEISKALKITDKKTKILYPSCITFIKERNNFIFELSGFKEDFSGIETIYKDIELKKEEYFKLFDNEEGITLFKLENNTGSIHIKGFTFHIGKDKSKYKK